MTGWTPGLCLRQPATRVALIYVILAAAWILGSDRLVLLLATDMLSLTMLQSAKGFVFVLVSAAVIYTLVRLETRRSDAIRKALESSEERFRLALGSSREAVWDVDFESRRAFHSPGMLGMLGYPQRQDAIDLDDWLSRVHAEDVDGARRAALAHLQGETPKFEHIHRVRHNDGHYVWVLSQGQAVRAGKGKAGRLVGTDIDITERKHHQDELERTNRALTALSACNRAIVAQHDRSTMLTIVCRNLVEMAGYRLAWIGMVAQSPAGENGTDKGPAARLIEPAASFGDTTGFLSDARAAWADPDHGRGPAAQAVRGGQTMICHDLESDETEPAWRFAAQAAGFRSAAAIPIGGGERVIGVLGVYAGESDAFDPRETGILETLARDLGYALTALERADAIGESERGRLQALARMEDVFIQGVTALSLTIEKRDPYTAGHQSRVAALALAIAQRLGLDAATIDGIRIGALIHDIGKIGIPSEILTKPGSLTTEEFALVKCHAQIGFDIIKNIEFSWPVGRIVLEHHERMDGSGYPNGLMGDAICMEARVVAVADVAESITSHRPYRPALNVEVAIEEITGKGGQRYDARVVQACIDILKSGKLPY